MLRAAIRRARPSPAAASSATGASARASRAPGARRSRPACRARRAAARATSIACRSASVSTSASLTRRRAAGIGERRRLVGAHDEAAPPLHRVEHRPDDVEVLAEQVRPRCEREDAMHRRQPAELARHVVRGRRHRAERRPADDDVRRRRSARGRSGSSGRRETARPPARATGRGPACRRPAGARAARRRGAANRAVRPAGTSRGVQRVRVPRRIKAIMRRHALRPLRQSHRSPAARSRAFMDEHVYPNEATFHRQIAEGDRWQPTAIVEELKPKARAAGLWNLFLPESEYGAGLTNVEYAPLCEIMGRVPGFGAGSLQLLGARHRQHGSAGPLRHRGAAQAVARAAARRADPLLLRDDRARRRLVGRDQHPVEHRAATATTTSSTAASGGSPAPAIRAAGSPSSWARPIPARRGTSSSR